MHPERPATDAPPTRSDGLRRWVPEGALAGSALVVGLVEIRWHEPGSLVGASPLTSLPAVLLTALAALLCRRAPGLALGLTWVVGALHVVGGTPLLLVELVLMAVFFGTARWGTPAVVALGGISVPASMLAALALYQAGGFGYLLLPREALHLAYEFGRGLELTFLMMALALLAGPWLAGLALRFLDRASRSRRGQLEAEAVAEGARREMAQAQEIARLREEQTRLAHDVHDVVGHSLAVILAQAESAQYADDHDTQRLKDTMRTIATSARSSLQDVRHVLSTGRQPTLVRTGRLDDLVDGVRSSGHAVESSEFGRPQPLPPELEVVTYRVLQEMLTNAMRHGRRDQPVRVERHWPDAALGDDTLRIEVGNVVLVPNDPADPASPAKAAEPAFETERIGQGLGGMRRRLESVGGRLDVRRRVEGDRATFTATAWVPVRPPGSSSGRAPTDES